MPKNSRQLVNEMIEKAIHTSRGDHLQAFAEELQLKLQAEGKLPKGRDGKPLRLEV